MHKSHITIYRRVLVLFIVLMFTFPMMEIKGRLFGHFTIQERAQPITRPTQLWSGFVKHEWQAFLEQRFLYSLGNFRAFLIISHNEAKHKLFRKRPIDSYIWTPEMGYYPVDTIQRFNYDFLHHDAIKQHYQSSAYRLRVLQKLLQHNGVTMLVVPAPSKVRLYPEYVADYLIAPMETVLRQVVSYGDVLEGSGVNVLNVQRILAERKTDSPWPFFTTTSFHWSYWTGCIVTNDIMRKAETLSGKHFMTIDCADVAYEKSKWADADIAMILNIFSKDAIIGNAPFPKITSNQNTGAEKHKIVVIGDSFSDQIVYALTQALPEMSWTPDWLVSLDLRAPSRRTALMNGELAPSQTMQMDAMLPEILAKELVILEVSDGHVARGGNLDGMEFGATRILLDGLLPNTDNGMIDTQKILVDGWQPVDNGEWHTTGHLASFAIRPPTKGNSVQIILDAENMSANHNKPRLMDIIVDGHTISQAKIPSGRGAVNFLVPNTIQWQDSLVAEITLRDASGQPLDILLHGVRMVGVNAGKTANARIATQSLSPKAPGYRPMNTINLISNETNDDLSVEGLSGLESNGKESWRWALGPATRIKFYVDPALPVQERQFLLKFAFKNGVPIPDQAVTISLNGEDIRRFSSEEIGVQKHVDAELALSARKGVNVLEIAYQDWNHGKKNYGNDPRQLAVVFMHLSLQGKNK